MTSVFYDFHILPENLRLECESNVCCINEKRGGEKLIVGLRDQRSEIDGIGSSSLSFSLASRFVSFVLMTAVSGNGTCLY